MKTIILPGYSLYNREWAEEIKKRLSDVYIHEWKHWITTEQKDFSVKNEVQKILEEVGNSYINVIAKSIGTLVAASLLNKIGSQIKKLILCGIPTAFISDNRLEDRSYLLLKDFPSENVLVIQNKKDPLASFEQIKTMFSKINPKIKVIEKDREDHNYPFYEDYEDIEKFLSE